MELSPKVINRIIDENIDKPVIKKLLKKKIAKIAKKQRLTTDFLKGQKGLEWAFRIFAANMILGDYSWWGWETRSGWAWKLANEQWFYPKWDGSHKKLLVVAEQGLGDEILFASCARELAQKADVFWEIDSRLIPIMKRSIPEVNWITRWKKENTREPYQLDDHRGDYEAFIPAGNVPKLFRNSKESFPKEPFLIPNPELKWDLKGVGYVNKGGAHLEKRSEVPGDHDLHHFSPLYRSCKSLDDYISLIASLDYVNCVPSAVTHICGAIGQTCNVIRPEKVQGERHTALKWYYPDGPRMDWYGNHVRVFDSARDYNRWTRAELKKKQTRKNNRPKPSMPYEGLQQVL